MLEGATAYPFDALALLPAINPRSVQCTRVSRFVGDRNYDSMANALVGHQAEALVSTSMACSLLRVDLGVC